MHSELKWFILLLIGLWIAWVVTGGVDRAPVNRTHPFLEQPFPIDNGQIYTFKELKEKNRKY